MIEKKEGLLQKINNLVHQSLETFCVENNICPDCAEQFKLNELTRKDGETVCTYCGTVWQEHKFSSTIPFGDAHTPGNLLAEGRGLGGTLGDKGMFCVLAKQTGTVVDLPIRARHTMILTSKHEHPRLATLLKLGKRRCQEWNLADPTDKPQNIMFSNSYGEMLRTVGAYLVVRGLHFDSQLVADTCFALTFRRLGNEQKFEEAVNNLEVPLEKLWKVKRLYEGLVID